MPKNSIHSILFIALAVFLSCKDDDWFDKGSLENKNPETLIHDGETREYLLYVPGAYNVTSSVPLMMNFHGFGMTAAEQQYMADMRPIADTANFILVYPQGSLLDGDPHWNTSLPGGDNKSSADDFGFVEAMINHISSEYNIDTNRIYACGYSNGGMFAYGLANFKSELVAGVASVSGTMLDFNGSTSHPMPVMHLHGTSDGVIPYSGNSYYSSAQYVLDYWIDFNNTVTVPIVNSDSGGGMTIERYSYGEGDNGASVEHYKYIDGGHDWFDVDYKGANTGELIWNFLSKYGMDGLR